MIRQQHGHPNNSAIVRHLCLRLPEAKKAEYDETSQAQKEELPPEVGGLFCESDSFVIHGRDALMMHIEV